MKLKFNSVKLLFSAFFEIKKLHNSNTFRKNLETMFGNFSDFVCFLLLSFFDQNCCPISIWVKYANMLEPDLN